MINELSLLSAYQGREWNSRQVHFMGNHFDNIVVFLVFTLVNMCLFAEYSHHFPICEEFFKKCDTELKKVNLFYSGSLLRKM